MELLPFQAIAMFIGSIARTNLECDLVQRGGSLVEASTPMGAAAAISSPSVAQTNKPKFCFSKSNYLGVALRNIKKKMALFPLLHQSL